MGRQPGRPLRLFIAVEVPTFSVPGLRPSLTPSGSTTHLTLKFLGDTPEGRVGEIGHALERSLQGAHEVPVVYHGLGAFPSARRPRVLWMGVTHGREGLQDLARRVEEACAGLGFPREDRPFVPHVTLRRFRPGSDVREVPALLEQHRETTFGSHTVRAVELKQSELGNAGARHTTLVRIPLARPPA